MKVSDFVSDIHKKCTDYSYSKFNLEHHPGYSQISIRWMVFPLGAFAWDKEPLIYIRARDGNEECNNCDSLEEIFETTCHETGHFLHCCANVNVRKVKDTLKNRFLREIIADLGIFPFIAENYGHERLDKYRANMETHSTEVAFDIFKRNPLLLSIIAYKDIRHANRLIRPLLERELYPDSLPRFFRGY